MIKKTKETTLKTKVLAASSSRREVWINIPMFEEISNFTMKTAFWWEIISDEYKSFVKKCWLVVIGLKLHVNIVTNYPNLLAQMQFPTYIFQMVKF